MLQPRGPVNEGGQIGAAPPGGGRPDQNPPQHRAGISSRGVVRQGGGARSRKLAARAGQVQTPVCVGGQGRAELDRARPVGAVPGRELVDKPGRVGGVNRRRGEHRQVPDQHGGGTAVAMWCPRRAHTPGHGFASGARSRLGNRARASRAKVSTVPASTASANATPTHGGPWTGPTRPPHAAARHARATRTASRHPLRVALDGIQIKHDQPEQPRAVGEVHRPRGARRICGGAGSAGVGVDRSAARVHISGQTVLGCGAS